MKYQSYGIGLFAYNRPSHFKRVLIALENYKVCNLNIFIDGPKNDLDKNNQKNIFFIAKNSKLKKIKTIRHDKNLGLKKSINIGAKYLANKYEKFVILEDDCIPYKNFFPFFEYCFKRYENISHINSICSYQFDEINNYFEGSLNSLLLDHFIPWGWGTWSKKWKKYEKYNKKNFKNFPLFLKKYNSKLYRKRKERDIWSLDYILYQFEKNMKSVYPNINLLKNIGFDGSGTNTTSSSMFITKETKIKKIKLNKEINDEFLVNKHLNIIKKKIEYFL